MDPVLCRQTSEWGKRLCTCKLSSSTTAHVRLEFANLTFRADMELFSVEQFVAVGVLLFAYLYWRVSRGPGARVAYGSKLPPVESGWVPWLGCAVTFGKEPLWFIKKTNDKVTTIIASMTSSKTVTNSVGIKLN